jgi:acyl transferase domain-containing protein
LVRRACANADVEPSELDYVELHGTGTAKGDPIEARALGEALAVRSKGDPCLVGSIKTNIGHCESAAGIASVIKVALALHHRVVPATINHTETHPAIDSGALGVELVTEARRWPVRSRPLLAGVSGLSLGGGNAHIVLEQAPVAQPRAGAVKVAPMEPLILPVSARTVDSLCDLALAFVEHLEAIGEDQTALRAVCVAAALRRKHHERRLAVVAETAGGLVAELRRCADGLSELSSTLPQRSATPRVALLLSASLGAASRRAVRGRVVDLGVEPVHTFIGDADSVERGQEQWDLLLKPGPQSSMQELAATLYRAGCQVRWSTLYGPCCRAVALPTYRWKRERLWIDPIPSRDFEDPAPEPQNAQHSQPPIADAGM